MIGTAVGVPVAVLVILSVSKTADSVAVCMGVRHPVNNRNIKLYKHQRIIFVKSIMFKNIKNSVIRLVFDT